MASATSRPASRMPSQEPGSTTTTTSSPASLMRWTVAGVVNRETRTRSGRRASRDSVSTAAKRGVSDQASESPMIE